MKSDKEIALVEKKTNFSNFWKPIEKDNEKMSFNNSSFNSINSEKKKNKLEIIGLSYIDPSKKKGNNVNGNGNEKKLDNNKLKKILESKHKNLLNKFSLKIKGKGLKILSKIEKTKSNSNNDDESINIDNKTDRIFNRNNFKFNNINEYNEGEEFGVPLLNTLNTNKKNPKLKTICKIDVAKLADNNIYTNNTISSCRHSSTNGDNHYFISPKRENMIFSKFNGKYMKKMLSGKNNNSFRSLRNEDNDSIKKIKYSYSGLNNNVNFSNNIINQSNITNYINNINNNIYINTNNNSYINPENRIYRKKFSFKKIYTTNSIQNKNEENVIGDINDESYNFKKVEKPKAIRLKKLELFKIPVYNSKIKKLKNYYNNINKNEDKNSNKLENN